MTKHQWHRYISFSTRNTSTGRPQVHCLACGGNDHYRKDCQEDNFCTKCRSRSHATQMCHAPTNTGKANNICIYCGSKNHTSGNCTSQPNDNREEPRSTPRDLHNLGWHFGTNTENSGVSWGDRRNSTNPRPARPQVQVNDPFPYKDYRYDQDRSEHQQTRFDERYNRQYSPNYNYVQPSPLVSIAGPNLSATLIDLANISPDH